MTTTEKIKLLADKYAIRLKQVTEDRVLEMKDDDISHYLIYRVLGVQEAEGKLIDVYQNKGRFLYKYAGSFLEEATKLCFLDAFPESSSVKIPNTLGLRPKTFEIDCLVGNDAFEIKWKDATTDGDHITKEHTRIKVISDAGYRPIRVMFYYPNRSQAIRIQETLKTLYEGISVRDNPNIRGQYFQGEDTWAYVKERTLIDLKAILEEIADNRVTDEI